MEVEQLGRILGRRLALIAESDLNDPRVVWPRSLGGYGIDAQWSDDVHHALHALLSGERDGYYADFGSIADVATALRAAYVYAGRHSAFRGRRHGRPAAGLPGEAFVAFLQNHDQVGNRARGERSTHLLSPGRAMIGAALVLTAPYVPLLFQGEEWGASAPFQYFTAHEDAGLGERVRNGRRDEFARFAWNPEDVPDPQDEATFQRSKLDWEELARTPHRELLDWHRALIRLRRASPALLDGRREAVQVHFDEAARWLVVARGPFRIAINLADRPQSVPLPPDGYELVMSSAGDVTVRPDGVMVRAESVIVLRAR